MWVTLMPFSIEHDLFKETKKLIALFQYWTLEVILA